MKKTQDLSRRAEWLASQTFVVLAVQVPRENDKTPQSAEQFFAALHGIYRGDPIVQEHVSFELCARKDSIIFYIFTPLHLRDFIESQLYAQYPNLQIRQVGDYTKDIKLEGKHVAFTRVGLTKEDVFPVKTYTSLEVDPLAGITAVLSKLDEGEQVWLQLVIRPLGDEWQSKGIKYVQEIRNGKPSSTATDLASKVGRFGVRLLKEALQPGWGIENIKAPEVVVKLSAPEEAALKAIESKVLKLGFETVFRIVAISSDVPSAKGRVQAVLAALKQYNTTNLNGFTSGEIKADDYPTWQQFLAREFEETGHIMNIEELASVYHFPNQQVETSAISRATSKKGEAPFNLPLKENVDPQILTVLGKTDFRNDSKEFGIKLDDRKRHIYVIGKSGVGKSTLLENMLIDDINEGRGIVLVDPHGELADKVIDCVPAHRIEDIVVFDPADRAHPVAFNVLESVGEEYKGMVASGFVGIFKKLYFDSWGPRLEYILRNTVLALLDSENPTMLGIPRMLTDDGFRSKVVSQIKDVVIRDFWTNEWTSMSPQQRAEAPGSILNKVGQFLSTSTMRNIVGQPKSSFNIREIMDQKKILIVNLSKGKIGEDNMALLGAMIITKVQLAAMSRADTAPENRPDCFLYVDEFQNFATESFATILSEARKYNLGLTIAHQYIAQMSEQVKDAVIGNVGSMISFRVGSPDAEVLVKEFTPVFDAQDMVNLERGHVYVKLLIDGVAAPAFSAQTMPPRPASENFREKVIESSRRKYSLDRGAVEEIIDEAAGYKQKREAEEATKAAQEMLNKGASIAIHPVTPAVTPAEAPRAIVAQPKPVEAQVPVVSMPLASAVKVVDPVGAELMAVKQAPAAAVAVEEGSAEELEEEKAHKEPKPLKIMNGWVYKEVAQKGGSRWFLGEKEGEVMKRLEEKQRMLEEKNSQSLSPVSPPPTEHMSNEEEYEMPVMQMKEEDAKPQHQNPINLEEGVSIKLP